MSAEVQLFEDAIRFCPDLVPDKDRANFEEFMKKTHSSKGTMSAVDRLAEFMPSPDNSPKSSHLLEDIASYFF